MTAGTDTFMGLAVPLRGHSKILGTTTALDVLTVDGATGASGDLLVLSVAGSEKFVVAYDGGTTVAGALAVSGGISGLTTKGAGLRLTPITTAPAATGWTKGDVFLAIPSSGVPIIGACTSTAADTIYYWMPTSLSFGYSTMPK